MGRLSDLSFKNRLFMKAYRYRTFDWAPGSVPRHPLDQTRVAVITTAAFYLPHQPPFNSKIKGGDVSFREIPFDVDLNSLLNGHKSDAFDHSGIALDPNLALPLDRLREMEREELIGAVNHRHFSFMGSITAPGRLVAKSAPELAALLRKDGVDVALLTPV